MRSRRPSLVRALATVAMLTSVGCARGEITLPMRFEPNETTVDASAGWVYLDLAAGAPVAQTDASTSLTWDVGFNATNVALNGGASGPAAVTGFCLCQNAGATNDQILAMRPADQQAAFDAVTATSIPPQSAAWSSDVFTTSRWYKYNLAGDNRISPTFDVYLLQRGAVVYKLQLIDYYGPAGETRRIAVRYARLRG
jgi:hypothetical protein